MLTNAFSQTLQNQSLDGFQGLTKMAAQAITTRDAAVMGKDDAPAPEDWLLGLLVSPPIVLPPGKMVSLVL